MPQQPKAVAPVDWRSLKTKTGFWIDSVLRNDENSTDDEMTAYFIENGVPENVARAAVAERDKFMGRID